MPTQFHQACDSWFAVARKDMDFGSDDTEPRGRFADIVEALAQGCVPRIPTNVAGWELYSGEGVGRGGGLQASRLTRAARKVVAAAEGNLDDVRAYCDHMRWWY